MVVAAARSLDTHGIYLDTFIQKTKKLYNDTRSQRNLSKVSEELAEVHSIFTQSISELVSRGERLNSTSLQPKRERTSADGCDWCGTP